MAASVPGTEDPDGAGGNGPPTAHPNPALVTERLRLRDIASGDLQLLIALDSEPGVKRYIDNDAPVDVEDLRDMLEWWLGYRNRTPGRGFWMAFRRSADDGVDPEPFDRLDRFVGWFHLRAGAGRPDDELELGYRLRKSAWGSGLATEGSAALLDYAFTVLGARLVYAETMAINIGSRRVMEKLGMQLTREFQADWPVSIPGDQHGDVEYAIVAEHYHAGGHDRAGRTRPHPEEPGA